MPQYIVHMLRTDTVILYIQATLDRIHAHKVVAGPEKAGCPVGLGCIHEVVGDGHKGDLPAVKILVQDLWERGRRPCVFLVRYDIYVCFA